MGRHCEICGKGPRIGHSVSHSHVRTKRRWRPNLQRVKGLLNGRQVNIRVCAKCIKAGKVSGSA